MRALLAISLFSAMFPLVANGEVPADIRDLEERVSHLEIIPVASEEVILKTLNSHPDWSKVPKIADRMLAEFSELAIELRVSNRLLSEMSSKLIVLEKDTVHWSAITKINARDILEIKAERRLEKKESDKKFQKFLGGVIATLLAAITFAGRVLFVKYIKPGKDEEHAI
jgi:hypothetical protein